MPLRRIYFILFFGSLIASALLLAHVHVVVGIVAMIALPIVLNFWYGAKIGMPIAPRIFASIFWQIGFFAMMGYDKNLISAFHVTDQVFTTYIKNFRKLFTYSCTIVGLLLLTFLVWTATFTIAAQVSSILFIIMIIVSIGIALAVTYLSFWLSAALVTACQEADMQQPLKTLRENMVETKPKIWRLIGARLLGSIIAGLPLVIALVLFSGTLVLLTTTGLSSGALSSAPAMITSVLLIAAALFFAYMSLQFVFVTYTVLFENTSVTDALRSSYRLVQGHWWALVWRLGVTSFFLGLISAIGSSLIDLLNGHHEVLTIVAMLLNYLLQALLMPLFILVVTVLYNETRRIKGTVPAAQVTPTP